MNHITAQDLPSVPTMSFDSDDVGGGAMMRHSGPRDTRRGKMKKALHITLPAVLALTLSACATAPQQQAAPQTGNTQQQAEIKELKDRLAPLQSFLKEVGKLNKDEKDALASLVPVLAALGDSEVTVMDPRATWSRCSTVRRVKTDSRERRTGTAI